MIKHININEPTSFFEISVVVDTHIVLCGRNTLLHSEQHFCYDVYQDGRAQRSDGALYQPALSAVDIETALESDCGPVQDQEMVDNNDADIDVGVICPAHLQYPASI